jgi:hypothetical protein
MRRKKTVADYFKHARRRAIERYDLWLTRREYEQMIQEIQQGKHLLLQRESCSRTHWLVSGQYIVVYEKVRKGIVTFLPPEAIDNYLTNRG